MSRVTLRERFFLFDNEWGRDLQPAGLVAVEFQRQLAGRLEPLKSRAARLLERLADRGGSMIDFFERVAALRREGQSFAVATVVARRAPVSAHLGDRAIIFADGRMDGFVGGACAREIIRQQALEALAARQGRLVSIRPDTSEPLESNAEHVVVAMSCASEGAVEVYVDPMVHARSLIVVGATPVAGALARLARTMEYSVVRVVEGREQSDVERESTEPGVTIVPLDELERVVRERPAEASAVVASQGHYDEQALEAILKAGVSYVGLVASRKRAATVRSLLEERGVAGAATMRSPVGLDLGARTAPEVALSILAEIVQAQASQVQKRTPVPAAVAPTNAVDPVCGMSVNMSMARHTAEVEGLAYYFCCANCRATFLRDPQAYQARP
jgi:xanthine dehydrogenase accessory factor